MGRIVYNLLFTDLLDGNNGMRQQNGSASSSSPRGPVIDVVNGTSAMGPAGAATVVRPAGSKGSVSTRSTTSQNSWEENRSVGGEVEVEVETPMEILRYYIILVVKM